MAKRLIVHAYGTADSDALATALRVARHSSQELGKDVKIQIVVQGAAVRLLTRGTSYREDLADTTASGSIEVLACENSMKSASVDPAELLPMIVKVPSASPTSRTSNGRAPPTCGSDRQPSCAAATTTGVRRPRPASP